MHPSLVRGGGGVGGGGVLEMWGEGGCPNSKGLVRGESSSAMQGSQAGLGFWFWWGRG